MRISLRGFSIQPAGTAAVILLLPLPVIAAENGPKGQILMEGNSFGALARPVDNIGGAGFHFEDTLPTFGRLTMNQEGLGRDGHVRTGEDYLKWQFPVWHGVQWTITGGDFRTPTNLLDPIFGNFFFPEVTGRGISIEAADHDLRYGFYFGGETLPASGGNLFRVPAPQRVMGAFLRQRFGKRLLAGARFSSLSSSAGQIIDLGIGTSPFFLPPERRFHWARAVTAQATYTITKHFRLYGELSPSAASSLTTASNHASAAGGAAWDYTRLTIKANYASQGLSYSPLDGYYLGDRRGPFAELRYQITKRLVVNGSGSTYLNNVEGDPARPEIRTTSSSAGASLVLPWKLTAGTQMTDSALTIRNAGAPPSFYAGNLQIAGSLGRPVRKHNLRFYVRELRLTSLDRAVSRLSPEFEDMVQSKRFTAGGAVRLQEHAPGFRGTAEARLARFTAHADVETGNLTASSVSAANTMGTMSLRGSAHLGKTWTVETQSSRIWLTSRPDLVLLRQWNVSLRLIKQL